MGLNEVNKLNTASCRFLVFLTPWFRKNKVPEIVFCGRVGIGCVCVCVFCMCFMIKKMTLEGFIGIWEAKYEGFSLEYFKKKIKKQT